MAPKYTRQETIARLKKEVGAGRPIYTVGAGTGISAKFAEAGGADLITTYPIAKFRMMGHSSLAGYLPLCDSNATTLEMGEREILPVIKEIPVAAGLLGADPTRDMGLLLDHVWKVGFSGILNCPTLACVDGMFRQNLEETGLSYAKEIEMIRLARERDLFTHAFCSNVEESLQMVEAGVDMVVAHMGNTAGGTTGSKTTTPLDEAVERIQAICDAVKEASPDAFVIAHGGHMKAPEDVAYILGHTKNVDGFMAGSSGERFPVEKSVTEVTRGFKDIVL
ncbi:MAG: phosphoenolpyruvate hydrolase family protein [Anaerolineae bacterium]|jgi:predicted TIM-barrel enzyme